MNETLVLIGLLEGNLPFGFKVRLPRSPEDVPTVSCFHLHEQACSSQKSAIFRPTVFNHVPNPNPREIGLLFKRTRLQVGWTQDRFAEKSGVGLGTIKNAERGRSIKPETHQLLLQTLNQKLATQTPPQPPADIPMVAVEQCLAPAPAGDPLTRSNTASPLGNANHIAICEALRLTMPENTVRKFRIGEIRSPAELKTLWAIDDSAYGETSITFEHFLSLWKAYPPGLRVLFCEDQIIGAIGIWPVTPRWAERMKEAQLKESELNARVIREAAKGPARFWYVTGIVLREDWIGTSAIKPLLDGGIGSWIAKGRIAYPCEISALAYSQAGKLLLNRFNFFTVQDASDMPDKYPLYGIQIASRRALIGLLKARRLTIV